MGGSNDSSSSSGGAGLPGSEYAPNAAYAPPPMPEMMPHAPPIRQPGGYGDNGSSSGSSTGAIVGGFLAVGSLTGIILWAALSPMTFCPFGFVFVGLPLITML